MAVKTASVNSRMRTDIKEQAEEILERLGIPRSVAIDVYYRQIISHNGIPFPLTVSNDAVFRDEMTKAQFDRMMSIGLQQAKSNESYDVDEVFDELEKRN